MWIKFNNGAIVNLSSVIIVHKAQFGPSIVLKTGEGQYTLKFANNNEQENALAKIAEYINEKPRPVCLINSSPDIL